MIKKQLPLNLAMTSILSLALLLQASSVFSQEAMQEEKASAIEEELDQGKKSIDELFGDLQKGDKKAIPVLRKAFDQSSDKEEKQRIASQLLRAGVSDEQYLNFLIQHARKAIESNMPFPLALDEDGKPIKRKYSAEFLAWCKEQGIDPNIAARNWANTYPIDVMRLINSMDPRASDTLLKGLESSNYIIVLAAAKGLARLQDKRAIRPIIESSKRVPTEITETLGLYLLYFDDAEAQSAAENLIRDQEKLNRMQKQVDERGLEGLLGF